MTTIQVSPKIYIDFTSAALSPLVTFTRAGNTATRINSSGFVEGVSADVARFDYNPSTLVCRGLLIEDSSTNLLKYSDAFGNALWGKSAAASVTSNTVTGPDNTLSADTLTFTAGAATVNQEVTVTSGATYTLSVWLRCASGTVSVDVGSINVGVFETKTVTTEWQRFTVTQAASAATRYPAIRSTAASTIYAWGAQLELGASATSYIPTTSAAVTRNADVATITGTNFSDWWQAGKGGVLVRARPGTVSGTRPWVQFDDGTADNLIAIRGNGTDPELYIVDSTTPQAQIDAGTIAANTDYAMTAWWNTDDCKAKLNSGAVVSDTSATIPTVDQMRIGSDGTNYINGHIASIGYYDRFSSQVYTRRKNKAVFSLL